MADGLIYCHICKCDAFPKTRFGNVVSLDCGHVERVGGGKPSVQDYKGSNYMPQTARGRRWKKPAVEKEPAPPVVEVRVEHPAPEPHRPNRSVSGTGNIANAIRGLMDNK